MNPNMKKRLRTDAVETYGSLPAAINSLKTLREHGTIAFTPPICGFLTRAGVLIDMSQLDLVIEGLEEE